MFLRCKSACPGRSTVNANSELISLISYSADCARFPVLLMPRQFSKRQAPLMIGPWRSCWKELTLQLPTRDRLLPHTLLRPATSRRWAFLSYRDKTSLESIELINLLNT